MYFTTTHQLDSLIDAYFTRIAGEFHLEDIPAKGKSVDETIQQKIWDRQPEPATISGLVLFLGFESRAMFNRHERKGTFASTLQRARLRVESEYEKKLHQPAPTGAIFALKNLGWNERDAATTGNEIPTALKIEVVDSGVPIASDERDVAI
ncbi:MAG: terminase small subunit [Bacteroidota bacterium]